MMLPLPGARVVCVVGAPLVVDTSRRGRDDRECLRAELERRLGELSRHADRLAGRAEEST
jgi:hypothetical protein